MDPNETLRLLREALHQWQATGDTTAAGDVAEQAENLDTWMSQGGFPPAAWQHREPSEPAAVRSYRHSDCQYCERYRRACGRHSEPGHGYSAE